MRNFPLLNSPKFQVCKQKPFVWSLYTWIQACQVHLQMRNEKLEFRGNTFGSYWSLREFARWDPQSMLLSECARSSCPWPGAEQLSCMLRRLLELWGKKSLPLEVIHWVLLELLKQPVEDLCFCSHVFSMAQHFPSQGVIGPRGIMVWRGPAA